MVILHDEAYYASRKPEPDLGPLRNFFRFIWNNEKKTFLDRTAKEWGRVGLFYLGFFAVLGSLFMLQMWISIDFASKLDRPFFQYTDVSTRALYAKNFPLFRSPWNFGSPGIVLKPNSPVSIASPLIWVKNTSDNASPKRYIRALTDFLQGYNKNISAYDPNCQEEKLKMGYSDKSCFFNVKLLGACSKPPYGYTDPMQPCVLIKFNKRFDWIPNYYNRSSNLPEYMPPFLQKAIRTSKQFHVWLSCDGANNVDKEHIGDVQYIPNPGFPIELFPFTGQPDYMSPIVALRFKNLTPNRLVTVECVLWAFNIDQRSRYSLDFQIMIRDGVTLFTFYIMYRNITLYTTTLPPGTVVYQKIKMDASSAGRGVNVIDVTSIIGWVSGSSAYVLRLTKFVQIPQTIRCSLQELMG